MSLIVREDVAWSSIQTLISGLAVPLLEECWFVGTYRGQQTGPGNKSVTLRLLFRDPTRTLTHDEVSPQVATVVEAAKKGVRAELRMV